MQGNIFFYEFEGTQRSVGLSLNKIKELSQSWVVFTYPMIDLQSTFTAFAASS